MDPTKAKLVIRNAEPADAARIVRLTNKVYGKGEGYTAAQIRGQINNFPDGQFVAEYEGRIVGYCATLIVHQAAAFGPHSWNEITGQGYGTRHDAGGDVLYGMEVCVEPRFPPAADRSAVLSQAPGTVPAL